MGKASSAKKVARAARAGGSRKSGQRRPMGFPLAIAAVLVLGLLLVLFARDRRNADAFPRANADHIHSAYDTFVCVEDTAAETGGSTTTTASTVPTPESNSAATTTAPGDTSTTTTSTPEITTTTAPTSTTVAAAGDVPGQFLPPFTDATQDVLGIHTHGDGLIHIHPFTDSVAGRNATMGVFLDQVGVSMTNDTLTLPSGQIYKEGTTKCQDGRDGQLQIAKWNNVADAAQGKKPNEIFTDGFDQIRLGANESFTIAFMPAGSTIPAKPDVATRIANVSDLQPSTTAPASGAPGSSTPTTGTVPGASGAPDTTPNTAPTSAPDTATTVPATSSP
jgi:cytoskeletal protein RodZ